MEIKFTKMQGIGNDFVIIDAYTQNISLNANQIRKIADRHFGIGCDQLLLVEKPTVSGADFRYRIFNADGGEVQQCGNGARCFVRFVHDTGLTEANEISVETASGIIKPKLEDSGLVTVDMGIPQFEPDDIPFITEKYQTTYHLQLNNKTIEISVVSMGNPHAVQIVDSIETAPVGVEGPEIENHPRFPERVNAGFMQIISPHKIRLRVYERGSGETLACGTGACAAAVSGIRLGLLKTPVTVSARGGELTIYWDGLNNPVLMTGPAETVFQGVISV